MTLFNKKLFMDLLKVVKQTLLRSMVIGIGTTEMEFCCGGERLGLTPNTVKAAGDF